MKRRNHRKRIAIISRESNEKTLDIAMLEEELLRRGCEVTVLSRLLTKERSVRALGYIGHVIRQEAAILASDVVVLDTYCIPASMIPHCRGTDIVQMWHALGAVKKFGWQTVGKEGGSSEKTARLMKMHHGYDHVVCASDITAQYFCEAFRTDRDRIIKCGLPRIDYIKSVSGGSRKQDTAGRILREYPHLKAGKDSGKKIVLYAPTFRKGEKADAESLIRALDPSKYEIVIKLHPVYRDDTAEMYKNEPNVIIDDSFTSYDWLSVCDIVISDYSSFVIEAALTETPLFIYAYDMERYSRSTGLNMDFDSEPVAPYVFRDAALLAECLEEEYDFGALHAFRDRYVDVDTQNCTSDLADLIEAL